MLEVRDLMDFSIHNWYEKFKHIAMQTILIQIPDELLNKFVSGDSDINIEKVCTIEFINLLKNALNSLNKNVFVKNNWHAPLDAKMFSLGNELKVTNLNDLILYLSTSAIISEDFATIQNIPMYLALKPWKNIHPGAEFRCIVINNLLRGITCRDWPTYYEYFKDSGAVIIDKITNLFKDEIKTRWNFRKSYIFDIIMAYPDECVILDFGPLTSKTNLYAFSWTEIGPLLSKETPADVPPVFRYLDSDIGIMSKTDAIYKISTFMK